MDDRENDEEDGYSQAFKSDVEVYSLVSEVVPDGWLTYTSVCTMVCQKINTYADQAK